MTTILCLIISSSHQEADLWMTQIVSTRMCIFAIEIASFWLFFDEKSLKKRKKRKIGAKRGRRGEFFKKRGNRGSFTGQLRSCNSSTPTTDSFARSTWPISPLGTFSLSKRCRTRSKTWWKRRPIWPRASDASNTSSRERWSEPSARSDCLPCNSTSNPAGWTVARRRAYQTRRSLLFSFSRMCCSSLVCCVFFTFLALPMWTCCRLVARRVISVLLLKYFRWISNTDIRSFWQGSVITIHINRDPMHPCQSNSHERTRLSSSSGH